MDIIRWIDEEEQQNKFKGLFEIVTKDYAEDILSSAFENVKKAFEKGEIKSKYGLINKFPLRYECVIGFECNEGAFLYQCRKTGDYIYIEFEKEECLSFLKKALIKGEE